MKYRHTASTAAVVGVVIVIIALVTVSATSFSYFSATVNSPDNTFCAGTLYLGRDEDTPGVLDPLTPSGDLSRLLPGESLSYDVAVTNLGNCAAYVNGLSAGLENTPHHFLANALRIKAVLKNTVLFEGALMALDGEQPVPAVGEILLAPSETATLKIDVALDPRTGNWYKGKRLGNISLALWATQLSRAEQPLETMVRIADGNVQDAINNGHPGEILLIPPGTYPRLQLPVTDMTVKALDVVYATTVAGFDVQAPGTGIEGFYVTGGDGGKAKVWVAPGASARCRIADNVIVNSGDGSIHLLPADGAAPPVLITRNDLRPPFRAAGEKEPIQAGAPYEAHNNLGVDLDPAIEAL